jgi:hypothetical protein
MNIVMTCCDQSVEEFLNPKILKILAFLSIKKKKGILHLNCYYFMLKNVCKIKKSGLTNQVFFFAEFLGSKKGIHRCSGCNFIFFK